MVGRLSLHAPNVREIKAYSELGVLRNNKEVVRSSLMTQHPERIQRRWCRLAEMLLWSRLSR